MTMPSTAPRSSTTSAMCWRSDLNWRSASTTDTESGSSIGGRTHSSTGWSSRTPTRSRRWMTPTVSSRPPWRTTGARECPEAASTSRAASAVVPVSRQKTLSRGTSTARSFRSAISTAPAMMVCCSLVKPWWPATMSRSSSGLISSRSGSGFSPAIRTTRSLVAPSSHTAGRVSVASRSSGRATSSAQRSGICIAIRLGASSPKTRVTKVSTRVTSTMATGSAARPSTSSNGVRGRASDTAAAAEARKPARVMPIWMVARKRLGSRARRASTCPARLLRASRWIWLSRSDTRASSLPAKIALMTIRTATRAS